MNQYLYFMEKIEHPSDRWALLMKELGLNQKDLAAEIGVTQAAISQIQRRNKPPGEQILRFLEERFGVNPFFLTNGSGYMFREESLYKHLPGGNEKDSLYYCLEFARSLLFRFNKDISLHIDKSELSLKEGSYDLFHVIQTVRRNGEDFLRIAPEEYISILWYFFYKTYQNFSYHFLVLLKVDLDPDRLRQRSLCLSRMHEALALTQLSIFQAAHIDGVDVREALECILGLSEKESIIRLVHRWTGFSMNWLKGRVDHDSIRFDESIPEGRIAKLRNYIQSIQGDADFGIAKDFTEKRRRLTEGPFHYIMKRHVPAGDYGGCVTYTFYLAYIPEINDFHPGKYLNYINHVCNKDYQEGKVIAAFFSYSWGELPDPDYFKFFYFFGLNESKVYTCQEYGRSFLQTMNEERLKPDKFIIRHLKTDHSEYL